MASSVVEALQSIPSLPVPDYLNKPPTGKLHWDLVPLITMLSCVPSLWLFYIKGRYTDLAAYSFGFWVAVIYHWLALSAHEGLASVSFLGVHGAAWRTVDIMGANVLLARTLGHALNVDHPLIAMLPNVVLPVTLLVLLLVLPGMGLIVVTRVTAAMAALTLALQLWVCGPELLDAARRHLLPPSPRVARALGSIALGLVCFALPTMDPDGYYAWHSLWHVCMGIGYYELYICLLDPFGTESSPAPAHKRQGASSKGSVGGGAALYPGENTLQALRSLLPRAWSPTAQQLAGGKAGKASPGPLSQGQAGASITARGRKQEQEQGEAKRGRSGSRGGARGRSRSKSRGAAAAVAAAGAAQVAGALQPRSSSSTAAAAAVPTTAAPSSAGRSRRA